MAQPKRGSGSVSASRIDPQLNAESFDLEITLITPYNHDFTMLTTVRIGQPFELTATNGAITNKVSGTLGPPIHGAYPLDLTVSEWASEKSNASATMKLDLELGKASDVDAISSVAFMRQVTLRRHEPHLKPKSPTA